MNGLELFTNNGSTTVSSSAGAPSAGTVQTWTVGSSSSFPGASSTAGTFFHVSDPAAPSEMILVTNVSGTTWTVTRGAEGTTPVSHSGGYTLDQVVTAGWLSQAVMGVPLAGPSATEPVLFQQPDGSIVVVPLSTYGISGDDGHWFNQAFTYFPTITGGGGSYGGTYNGPWMTGTIKCVPADYQLNTGILCPVNEGATVNIIGHGPGTRLFCASGVVGLTSHCAMGGPQAGAPAQQTMGTYRGLRFDGSQGGACGVEVGGSWGRHIDVACVNFNTGANTIGLHLNNAHNSVAGEWTEKSRISCDLMQNTIACLIENSNTGGTQASAADSMEYNDIDLYIIATNSSTFPSKGVVMQGGVFLSGGSLRIRGNFPAYSGPVLSIQGNDGAGGNTSIFHNFIDITVESNATSNQPQTINLGTNNSIHNCMGMMTFQFGTWVTATVASASHFTFGGVVDGDSVLEGFATTSGNQPNGWV